MKRKRSFFQCILTIAMAFLMMAAFLPVHAFAAEYPVKIDKDHFPDSVFREYVRKNIADYEDELTADAAEKVSKISISNVADLTGIEYFPNLEWFTDKGDKNLVKADFSNNQKLTSLRIQCYNYSSLETEDLDLNISNNKNLIDLLINVSNLANIDLSKNAGLRGLTLAGKFANLDLSNNVELQSLTVSSNKLYDLDLSKNKNLSSLSCDGCNLVKLAISPEAPIERKESYVQNFLKVAEKEGNEYVVDLSSLDGHTLDFNNGTVSAIGGSWDAEKKTVTYDEVPSDPILYTYKTGNDNCKLVDEIDVISDLTVAVDGKKISNREPSDLEAYTTHSISGNYKSTNSHPYIYIYFRSDNDDVARISTPYIYEPNFSTSFYANKAGTVSFTIFTYGDKEIFQGTFNVVEPGSENNNDTHVSAVSFNSKDAIYLKKGDTFQTQVAYWPYDASDKYKGVTYSSDAENIATVDENGLVTAVNPGVAKITATSIDNPAAYCDCVILVTNPDGTMTDHSSSGSTTVINSGSAIVSNETVTMYRLYNPNSGEHFYTSNKDERDHLISLGWNDEGTGWKAPKFSDVPVIRLYNDNAGEHHYTSDIQEVNALLKAGWKYEGIGWFSDPNKGVPVYRQYNPNQSANNHNYTTDAEEKNHLVSLGWHDEGIGWYGVK